MSQNGHDPDEENTIYTYLLPLKVAPFLYNKTIVQMK